MIIKIDTSWTSPSAFEGISNHVEARLDLSITDPLEKCSFQKLMDSVHEVGLPYLLAIPLLQISEEDEQLRFYDGLSFSQINADEDPVTRAKIKDVGWYLFDRQKNRDTGEYRINASFIGNNLKSDQSIRKVIKALKSQDQFGNLLDAGASLSGVSCIKEEKVRDRLIKRFIKRAATLFIHRMGAELFESLNIQPKKITTFWVEIVKKAAEKGEASAMFNLGLCYKNGIGVEKNLMEAVKWFKKAAEKGEASAMYNLGLCYHYGKGVRKNKMEAVKWYRQAADKGIVHAMKNLGLCYKYGTGVRKNKMEAVKWFNRAANKGDIELMPLL